MRPGQLLVHTSGRYGAKVLDPALRAGALPLALHPAMTFTGTPVDVQRLAGCSFGVTAPERAAAGRRGPGHRDGRRARVDRRGDPPALPRGPRPRRQPPGHPGRPVHGAAAHARASRPPTGCSARCSAPPSTTPCAPATRPSPARSRAATRARSPRTSPSCASTRPQTVAGYLAMARATADRALAHGLLKPELAEDLLGRARRRRRPRETRGSDPMTDPAAHRRRTARAPCAGAAGAGRAS